MSADIDQGKETTPEMVLVPRIPTKGMIEAAWASATAEDAETVWADMIKAWMLESRKGVG